MQRYFFELFCPREFKTEIGLVNSLQWWLKWFSRRADSDLCLYLSHIYELSPEAILPFVYDVWTRKIIKSYLLVIASMHINFNNYYITANRIWVYEMFYTMHVISTLWSSRKYPKIPFKCWQVYENLKIWYEKHPVSP